MSLPKAFTVASFAIIYGFMLAQSLSIYRSDPSAGVLFIGLCLLGITMVIAWIVRGRTAR